MTRKTVDHTLHDHVVLVLEDYFEKLSGLKPSNIYDMTIREVEKAILETVLKQAKNNQTTASKYLGLNRSTLRKKLKAHDLYNDI